MDIKEIRVSLLEIEEQELKDHKGAAIKKEGKPVKGPVHTKHVTLTITDPKFLRGFQAAVAELLEDEQEACGIAAEDQLTLANCEDASAFHLSGKEDMTDEEKKKFSLHKKKKTEKVA